MNKSSIICKHLGLKYPIILGVKIYMYAISHTSNLSMYISTLNF